MVEIARLDQPSRCRRLLFLLQELWEVQAPHQETVMISKNLRLLWALSILSLSMCACQTIGGQPRYPFYTQEQIKDLVTAFDKKTIDDCMELEEETCRNKVINSQLEVIDSTYRSFKQSVSEVSGGVGITGDILSGVLSGASTVTNGAHAKSVLSAISTVITGGKTSIDSNLFLKQSAHVLIGRMDALRVKALLPIRQGLLQTADKYPLWQALRDVESYITASSISAAITDIEQNSGTVKNAAEDATQSIVTEKFGGDDNSDLLRDFWMPDGKVNSENQTKIREEMRKAKIDDSVSIAFFLNAAKYADARATAVKNLNLG
jgi:hypothetical protein